MIQWYFGYLLNVCIFYNGQVSQTHKPRFRWLRSDCQSHSDARRHRKHIPGILFKAGLLKRHFGHFHEGTSRFLTVWLLENWIACHSVLWADRRSNTSQRVKGEVLILQEKHNTQKSFSMICVLENSGWAETHSKSKTLTKLINNSLKFY